MKIGTDVQTKLSAAIVELVCEVRLAKVFPTVDSLSTASYAETKKENKYLLMILKPKLLKIYNLVQFQSSYATHLSRCDCQELINKEIRNWIYCNTLSGTPNLKKIFPLDKYLCFECIDKNYCNHSTPIGDFYQFLHFHRKFQYRPLWNRS